MSRVPPQTTKQAKAAHKARNRVGISETQRKQLERDSLLHRRAWASKERDKGHDVAAQNRAEKLQREQAALSDAARFGTQRRLDKFGHKSSQFHLNAFFHHGTSVGRHVPSRDEAFDADFDEDAVLALLKTPAGCTDKSTDVCSTAAVIKTVDCLAAEETCKFEHHDMEDMWQEFDSSTQIARDLNNGGVQDDSRVSRASSNTSAASDSDLFEQNITSFDMTEIPLDEARVARSATVLMPPPKVRPDATESNIARSTQCSFGHTVNPADTTHTFSATQLETYLDEDLVLTQV